MLRSNEFDDEENDDGHHVDIITHEGSARSPQWLDGIKSDLQKRAPHYWSDWVDALNFKILSSSIFIFFTSLAPAVTFSLYMMSSTKQQLGAIEILLSTAITGILFSVFGGQPLVILGVTGPVTILIASVYTISQLWQLPFLPFLAWAQLWAGVMHIVIASGNYCALLRHVTQFSCETFGMLIALIYFYTGFAGIYQMLNVATTGDYNSYDSNNNSNNTNTNDIIKLAAGYLQCIVALGTVLLASFFAQARHWQYFHRSIRSVLSDYAETLSIVCWTCVTLYITHISQPVLQTQVPTLFLPSDCVPTSTQNRLQGSFFVDLSAMPVWGIFASIFPGIIITVLFFFDHNVSSIMAQHPDFQLTKGSAFHWDFFVLGICVMVTGVLGLPPTNGLIPQAPLHTKSLIVYKQHTHKNNNNNNNNNCSNIHNSNDANPTRDGNNNTENIHAHNESPPSGATAVETVYEQRVTSCLQACFIGISLFYPFSNILSCIPTSVLYGLFVYLGFASLTDNVFLRRLCYLTIADVHHTSFVQSHNLQAMVAKVSPTSIWTFTLLQVCLCAIIYVSTFTIVGVIFPVLIGALVGIRAMLLPWLFEEETELAVLDAGVMTSAEREALEACSSKSSSKSSKRRTTKSSKNSSKNSSGSKNSHRNNASTTSRGGGGNSRKKPKECYESLNDEDNSDNTF